MAKKDFKIRVTPEEIARAPIELAKRKGTGSFVVDILGAPIARRPALSEAVAKYRLGLRKADIAAGEALAQKAPAVRGMLGTEIRTPIKMGPGQLEVSKVQRVRRLSAPLAKAQRFIVPILAYEALRRIGEKAGSEATTKAMTKDEQEVLLKAAGLIEKLGQDRESLIALLAQSLHEKSANKLAHSMVDKGLIAPEQLEKKASELAGEPDLGIVKRAVDLAQSGFELGKLESVTVEGQQGEELDPMTDMLVGYIQGR